MNRLTEAIAKRILAWAKNREPDFVIGEPNKPYLNRHWLTPWSRLYRGIKDEDKTLWQKFVASLPGAYVHQFLRSDDDRALHDHPWTWNLSWLLDGPYREWVPSITWIRGGLDDLLWVEDPLNPRPIDRKPGSWYFRLGRAPHRVELTNGPVWTLFITGFKWRTWGFYCPNGWRRWQDFCEPTNKGQVGKGCD